MAKIRDSITQFVRKFPVVTLTTIIISTAVAAEKIQGTGAAERNNASGSSSSSDLARGANASLGAKSVEEIVGMSVENSDNGKTVGEVDALVTDRNDRQLHAVIAVDQFMDLIGGKKIVVPIDDLQLKDDKLQISATEKELKKRPEYSEEGFFNVSETNRPISDFARMEAGVANQKRKSGSADQNMKR